MGDGSFRTVIQDTVPVWRIGERVRVENGGLLADPAYGNPAAYGRH